MIQNIKNEKGVALLLVLFVIVMVTALITMGLNMSGMERNIASINQRTIESFHAAGGNTETSNQLIRDTLEDNALPTDYPAAVVVDPATAGGDPALPDLVEELRSGGGLLANDSVYDPTPDLLITSFNDQTIRVDIDKEKGKIMMPGSEMLDFAIEHHKKTGGTGCASGSLYSISAVSEGGHNTNAKVGSAYYSCQ